MSSSTKTRPDYSPSVATASMNGDKLHRPKKRSRTKKETVDVKVARADTPEEPSLHYRTTCPCDSHYAHELIDRDYNFTADRLFDLIFGTNDFVSAYRKGRRFYDEISTEWSPIEATDHLERTLNYKLPYASAITGKGTILTREKQTIFHQVPGSHYILETEVFNEGVKYTDTFSLILRYCLIQTSPFITHIKVTAQVQYHKNVNFVIKQFIEHSTYAASKDSFDDLLARLDSVVSSETGEDLSALQISTPCPALIAASQLQEDQPILAHSPMAVVERHPPTPSPAQPTLSDRNPHIHRSPDPDVVIYLILFLIGALFFLHIYLYLKLTHMDMLLDNMIHLLNM